MLNDFKFQTISTHIRLCLLREITTYKIIYTTHCALRIKCVVRDYETAMLKHFLFHLHVRNIYTTSKYS